MILKAVAAVVAHFVVVITGTAVTAVVFLIAACAASLAAVVAVVAFPVIIAPAAAVITFHAVFIVSVSCHRNTGEQHSDNVFENSNRICMTIMQIELTMYGDLTMCMFRFEMEMLILHCFGV